MSFVIRFQPGESVTIDGIKFAVERDPPSLRREGHPPVPIHRDIEAALPEVMVHLACRQHPGYLAVAFDAPHNVLIVRNVAEDVL